MSKKIIGLLLALCLVVGLLPMAALAEDTAKTGMVNLMSFTKVTVTEGGAAVYYKNSSYEAYEPIYAEDGKTIVGAKPDVFTLWKLAASDEKDWNVKVEYPTGGVVTVTLKDAKMANAINGKKACTKEINGETGEIVYKSTGDVGAILPSNDVSGQYDIKVILEGDNFIDCNYGVIRGAVNKGFSSVTVEGKEGNKLTAHGGAVGITPASGGKLSFVNANVDIATTNAGGSCVPIRADSISIEGGHVKSSNTINVAIQTLSGDLTITDAKVTAISKLTSASAGTGAISVANNITVNGNSELNLEGQNNAGMNANGVITINGGKVNVTANQTGIYSKNPIKINGGTVEITSNTTAFNMAPVLAAGIDGVAGASADDADYYDETKYNKKYVKLGADVQAPAGTTPAGTTPAGTTPAGTTPAGTTPAGTTPAGTTPAGTTPAGTQGSNNPDTGDNGIVMFSALLLIAVFGIVAIVAFGKKNTIAE